jgi:hypothetical protein
MAHPQAGSSQAAQAGLVTAMGYDIERALNTLDVSSLRKSLPRFKTVIAGVVHRYGAASATLAARAYVTQRRASGVRTPFTAKPAPLPGLEQIGSTVDWATEPLWSVQPDLAATITRLEGSLDTLVLNIGRDTITANTERDRHARGWARIPEPGCCYFCALLAVRGAVYKDGSFDDANARFLPHLDTPSDVKTHDHCRCHVEPVFTAYEPSAQIREWQALYRDRVQGGADLLRTWRRVFDQHNSNPSGTETPTPQEG